jgi:hypothetical protein
MNTKPLFIPVFTRFYDEFKNGVKTVEYRDYGPLWNEQTCWVDRAVTISKGYGKKNRLYGIITKFEHKSGEALIHIKLT